MRSDRLLIALRAIAGLLLGTGVWWALAQPYTVMLARAGEALIRISETPAITRLEPQGAVISIQRADFGRTSSRPAVATPPLTVNIVLLTALFAANRSSLAAANVLRFIGAALLLIPLHVLAVIANVQSIYALKLGAWSEQNYGVVERNLWAAAAHFYIFVGGFAAAFLLWLLHGVRSSIFSFSTSGGETEN